MPLSLYMNAKHRKSWMLSSPWGLLALAPMLVSFVVAGTLPLAVEAQTHPGIEAIVMPESEVVSKYAESSRIWKELKRKHNVLKKSQVFITRMGDGCIRTEDEINHQAHIVTINYAKDLENWDRKFLSKVPEIIPIRDNDNSEIVDPQTRATEAEELSNAYTQTRAPGTAITVPGAIPDDFKLFHHAKRFVTSWTEKRKANQMGALKDAYAWTKKAANALDRTYELHMKYLLEGKPAPNPYATKDYLDSLIELDHVTIRHQIFVPTSQKLGSILKEIEANRDAGRSFKAALELEQKARESLDHKDVLSCLRYLRKRHEMVYPSPPKKSIEAYWRKINLGQS